MNSVYELVFLLFYGAILLAFSIFQIVILIKEKKNNANGEIKNFEEKKS